MAKVHDESLAVSDEADDEVPTVPGVVDEAQDGSSKEPRMKAWQDADSKHLNRANTNSPMLSEGMRKKSGMFEFANPEVIKEKVRMAKMKPNPYDVRDLYYKTGCIQWIAKHNYFENITLAIIVLNALWIWIDTDYNDGDTLLDAPPGFVVMDCLFFAYFFLELFIRFLAFERKIKCFCDPWFVFDTFLVLLYFFDPFVLTIMAAAAGGNGLAMPTDILRLFRLARLSRLVRMLRSLPELMILIKGMVTAAATVGYTMVLLLVITYVFAIALKQLSIGTTGDEENDPIYDMYFSSVPLAVYSLIIYATFLDNLADFCNAILAQSGVCLFVVAIYIILASLTVMNMLIGVLCEVVSAVAEEERESTITDKVYEKFSDICKRLDTNSNERLSWPEFQKIMDMPEALNALESVNVDPIGMIDFAEDKFFEDEEPKELTFQQFMEMVLDFRGGQEATLKDLMLLSKKVNKQFGDLKMRVEVVTGKLNKLVDEEEV